MCTLWMKLRGKEINTIYPSLQTTTATTTNKKHFHFNNCMDLMITVDGFFHQNKNHKITSSLPLK